MKEIFLAKQTRTYSFVAVEQQPLSDAQKSSCFSLPGDKVGSNSRTESGSLGLLTFGGLGVLNRLGGVILRFGEGQKGDSHEAQLTEHCW